MSKASDDVLETVLRVGRETERADTLTWLEDYAAAVGGDEGEAVLAAAEIILQGKHEGMAEAKQRTDAEGGARCLKKETMS